jgi:hypothetical protein
VGVLAVTATFEERMTHLIDSVGPGNLTAEVIVDQVYAKYQELRDDLVLHGGGQHHYTRDSLYEELEWIMGELAAHLLTADGSDIRSGIINVAEKLAQGVYERAPFEFGDLKASGAPHAYDNGAEIYTRPPGVHRLTREELRAKGDLRRLGLGNARNDALDRALGIGP